MQGVIQSVLTASHADCNHEAGTVPKERDLLSRMCRILGSFFISTKSIVEPWGGLFT